MRRKFLRYWTYFRRGHSTYMAFFISLMNFIVIQYRLLIQNIQLLYAYFSNLWMFAITFIITYTPVAVFIGWMDYKRLSVSVDLSLLAKYNPFSKDLAHALYYLADGQNEKAKEVIKKWFREE